MTRVLYAQDRRTKQIRPIVTWHDDGTLTSEDEQMANAIARLRDKRRWSGEQIFDYCAGLSNAYVRYFETSG
ncbi:hypothetical protein GCM10023224_31370 [Streptomonospora halophila]|uniref:Transposase n=1 Tax=Streptomonospora halophila TaxID=427369 RepID=A0ABP9GRH8_9ACTN